MTLPRDFVAMARLDFAEVLRSRWLVASFSLYAVLAGLFVLVGLRESTVADFTGMGRVLFSLCHALILILPLVALAVTGQSIGRAREDGSLEMLLASPVRRSSYLAAVGGVRFAVVALPLVVLLLALGGLGRLAFGQAIPWSFIGRAALLSAVLLFVFSAAGLAISAGVRSQTRAMTYLIGIWLLSVALLDFGLIGVLLAWRLDPPMVFGLAALNPVQSVRLALLSAAEPELSVLGPVGFYLSTRIGSAGLMALGVAWPLTLGCMTFAWTARHFRRSDVV